MSTSSPTPAHSTRHAASHLSRRAGVVVAAAALGLTGSVLTASAHTDGSASTGGARESVLHFGVRFSPLNVIDVPPRAHRPGDYQPGDYVVFSDKLMRAGRMVGKEAGSGLVTRLTKTSVQVYYTLAIKLSGGQIAAQGLSSNAPTKRLAITGGTGRFTDVSGHLDLVEFRHGTGTLTLTLAR
ncbi:MAG: hypothetical protein QOK30_3311 [Nocardioidaceae bacterium]|nr:hypothetical protein [Nocardioidaceae bacterium]